MAKIPRPDPNDFRYKKKTPSLDNKAKIQIVYDALISATENRVYGELELTPNPSNQLDKLFRYETLEILKWNILKETPSVFDIDESNYGKELVPENEREATIIVPGRITAEDRQLFRPAPLPENVPIKLTLFGGFGNWREAYLHKKRVRLNDLRPDGFRKVCKVILDIDEQFQVRSSPVLFIPWYYNVETKTPDARRDALTFLQNKGAVEFFDMNASSGRIKVEINVKEFQKLREEAKEMSEKPSSEPSARPKEKDKATSKPFKHLNWESITIQFIDGHNVKISSKDKAVKANYKEMGFEDSRDLKPDQQWDFLKLLAENDGEISWESSEAKSSIPKKKQLLCKALGHYFGIKDNPFYPYKDQKAYRIKISLLPESS